MRRPLFWILLLLVVLPLAAGVVLSLLSGSAKVLGAFVVLILAVWVPVAAIVVAFASAIFVHEVGHLVFGLWAKMRFRSMAVLGYGVALSQGKLNWYKARTPLAAGFVMMDPSTTDRLNLVNSYRKLVLGGPFFSVLYSGFMFGVHEIHLYHPRGTLESAAYLIVFIFMVISIALLPGTLLPYTTKGINTDMRLLLMLSKDSPARERFVAVELVAMHAISGARAREWPQALLEIAILPSDASDMECRARQLYYMHLMDSGRTNEALQQVERAHEVARELGKSAGFLLESAAFELAYAQIINGSPTDAESLLATKKQPHELTVGARERALAALAVEQGRYEEAERHIVRATEALDLVLKRYGSPSVTERAWIEDLSQSVFAA